MASDRNSVQGGGASRKLSRIPRYHDPKKNPKKIARRLRAPLRNPKVREIHAVQIIKRFKCPRASPRSPHHQKPSFSSQLHFFYCKRPIIGAGKPSIVKANIVKACNQRIGPSRIIEHVMKVSITCQSCALILHHSRNSP